MADSACTLPINATPTHRSCSTASRYCCMCRIFTASSASVVYLSFGAIPTDYAVLTFLVGLIFTMIGQVRDLKSCSP